MKIKEDFECRHCEFLKYSSTKYASLPNQQNMFQYSHATAYNRYTLKKNTLKISNNDIQNLP